MRALGLDFIRRVMITTGVVGTLAAFFIAVYYDWRFGLGLFIGCGWGITNLHLLRELICAAIAPVPAESRKIIFLAVLKFPVLYGLGFLILTWGKLSVLSFLIGFILLFAVVVLKVLGRMLNERLARMPQNMNSLVP